MGKFTEFKRKIAGAIVTYYYGRMYDKAVEKADARHAKEGETIYVIDHFIQGQFLSAINRKEFRFYIKGPATELHKNSIYASPHYGMNMLRQQAWYHTADRSEQNGLTETDKVIRRGAFIRSGLKKARLLSAEQQK